MFTYTKIFSYICTYLNTHMYMFMFMRAAVIRRRVQEHVQAKATSLGSPQSPRHRATVGS